MNAEGCARCKSWPINNGWFQRKDGSLICESCATEVPGDYARPVRPSMVLNAFGNEVYRDTFADEKLGIKSQRDSRYYYDWEALPGWRQYDTTQDAAYFGVWVDVPGRRTFTYCEGDRALVICPTVESFKLELADMERCYGAAPASVRCYGDDGSQALLYDARPSGDHDQVFGPSAIAVALSA